jgi:hypothetical protein
MTVHQELDRLLRHVRQWRAERGKQWDSETRIGGPLYHYTDYRALEGMLRTGEFWFTDIFHLNDSVELKYGAELAKDVVRACPLKTSNRAVGWFCDGMMDLLEHGLREVFLFHVASFTQLRDELSQWRAYGQGGRGVSIGISPVALTARPDGQKISPWLMMPMSYDRSTIEQRMREIITPAVGWLMPYARPDLSPRVLRSHLDQFASEISTELLLEAFRAKHASFSGEAEVRLSITLRRIMHSHRLRMRQNAAGQTMPYLAEPMNFREGGIYEVILGPLVDNTMAEQVSQLLRSHALNPDILLKRSAIPLRG